MAYNKLTYAERRNRIIYVRHRRAAGVPVKVIAKELGITPESVQHWITLCRGKYYANGKWHPKPIQLDLFNYAEAKDKIQNVVSKVWQ
jgi:hypothetical protein